MGERTSPKEGKEYLEVVFKILESDAPGFPVDTEACVQIWPGKFGKTNYQLMRIISLFQALLPGQELTEEFCEKAIEEDLLAGHRMRVRVTSKVTPKGEFTENTYAPV